MYGLTMALLDSRGRLVTTVRKREPGGKSIHGSMIRGGSLGSLMGGADVGVETGRANVQRRGMTLAGPGDLRQEGEGVEDGPRPSWLRDALEFHQRFM